jgi:hypothetical protein
VIESTGGNVDNGLRCCRPVFVTTHAIRYHEQVRRSILQVKNGDTILLYFSIANRQRRGVLPAHGTAFLL